jgi:N-acylneuraminate cytidylyltransferase
MLPLMPLAPAAQPWHSTQMAALPELYVQNASLEIAWSRVVFDGLNIAGVTVMPFFTDEAAVAQGKFKLPQISETPFIDHK